MSFKFRVLCALLCAVAAAMISLQYSQSIRADAQKMREDLQARYGGETVELVVSTKALRVGDVIEPSDVVKRDWVSMLAPADAYTRMEDVVGKTVKVPLSENAPITQTTFATMDEQYSIPEGYVALSIPLTEKLGLGQHIAPHTAVVAYEATQKASDLITSDMRVLYVQDEARGQFSSPSCVVAVKPQDVGRILTAQAKNSLKFVVPAQDNTSDNADASNAAAATGKQENAGENGAAVAADAGAAAAGEDGAESGASAGSTAAAQDGARESAPSDASAQAMGEAARDDTPAAAADDASARKASSHTQSKPKRSSAHADSPSKQRSVASATPSQKKSR